MNDKLRAMTIEEAVHGDFEHSELRMYIDEQIRNGIKDGMKELCMKCVDLTKAQLHYRESIIKLVGLYIICNLFAVLFVPVIDYLLDGQLSKGTFMGASYFIELVLGILFWSACVVGVGVLGMKRNQLIKGINEMSINGDTGKVR